MPRVRGRHYAARRMKTKLSTLAALLTLLPTLAQAHPGHGAPVFHTHPGHASPGWGHVLAIYALIALGMWIVRLARRA